MSVSPDLLWYWKTCLYDVTLWRLILIKIITPDLKVSMYIITCRTRFDTRDNGCLDLQYCCYSIYIVVVRFIGGGNQNTRRTSLSDSITKRFIVYISPWSGIELTTLAVTGPVNVSLTIIRLRPWQSCLELDRHICYATSRIPLCFVMICWCKFIYIWLIC